MRLIHNLIAYSCVLTAFLSAAPEGDTQSAEEDKAVQPLTEISIVALGPKPARRYGDRGQMLRARPNETPPSRLYYKGKEKGDKKTGWKSFNLTFNNPSAMQVISPGKELVFHKKRPNDGGYEKYVTIPAGVEGSRRVFFLLTSTKGPTPWKKAPLVRTITVNAES